MAYVVKVYACYAFNFLFNSFLKKAYIGNYNKTLGIILMTPGLWRILRLKNHYINFDVQAIYGLILTIWALYMVMDLDIFIMAP